MNLGELALVCYAYGAMTYDDSLAQFSRRVDGNADLRNEEHRLALLHWLNQWQCRQFSLAYHDLASAGLLDWFTECGDYLPPKSKNLWEIPEGTVEEYSRLFDPLAKKLACYREIGPGKKSKVSFGPTAAAKILFVLRPKVFVAWDESVRAALHLDGSGVSYTRFLVRLREELLELEDQCRSFDLELTDLPQAIGRPLSTPAQLMDEYYWATMAHGVVVPSRQQVASWLDWYTPTDVQPTLILRALGGGAEAAPRPVLVPPPVEAVPAAEAEAAADPKPGPEAEPAADVEPAAEAGQAW